MKLMYLHTLAFEEISVLKELCTMSSRETKLQITFIIQTSSIIPLQNFLAGKIGVGTCACTCVHYQWRREHPLYCITHSVL